MMRDHATLSATPPAAGLPTRRDPGLVECVLGMTHELRAPLNAVIGMSGLLLDGELAERQRQYVKSIHAAGESLSAVVADLLDLSRALSGRLPLEPIPFDLRSMVEETVRALGSRAESRGLSLRVDWRPELPRHVLGDPGRTRQVLGNLVGHAMHTTSRGEIVIRVALDGDSCGTPLIGFSVEDTGIGLPSDRLARVFDDYVEIDTSPYRSFGITGLGLRLSAELVRLMAGEIGAESELGRGSRFWFRLPMPASEVGSEPLVLRGDAPRAGERALFVEGDHAARQRFAEQLQAVGWDAAFADDLHQVPDLLARAAATGTPYRVCVLSDYAVRPSHAELAARLKASEVLRGVALVIVTAVGSPGEGKRLWHAGFAAYLRKPVPSEELRDALVALQDVGADGRGTSLVTRHSIAEARHARAYRAADGLDMVLAEISAPVARRVAVIGASTADQLALSDALAQAGYAMAAFSTLATEPPADDARELVLVDTDLVTPVSPERLGALRRDAGGRRIGVVAMTVDLARTDELLRSGFDAVIPKPIRRPDLDRVLNATWPPAAEPGDDTVQRPAADPPRADTPEEPATELEGPAMPAVATEPTPLTGDSELTVQPNDPAAASAAELEAPAAEPEIEVPAAQPETVMSVAGPKTEAVVERPEGIVTLEDTMGIETIPPPVDGFVADSDDSELPSAVVEPVQLVGPGDELVLESAPPAPASIQRSTAEDLADSPGTDPLPGVDLAEPPGLTLLADTDPTVETSPSLDLDLSVALEPESAPARDGSAPIDSASTGVPAERQVTIELSVDSHGAGHRPTPTPADSRADFGAAFAGEVDTELELTGFVDLPMDSAAPQPPTSPEPGTAPVLGEALVAQLAAGSGAFAEHLVSTFLRDAPGRIAEVEQTLAEGDAVRLTAQLRQLEANAALLGAGRLGAACRRAAEAASAQDLDAARGDVRELNRLFDEVRVAIEAALPRRADPAEQPAIGEAFLQQLAPGRDGGARSLAVKLAQTFRAEAPERLDQLITAISREDAEAVQRLAPTLKGMCALISAQSLAKLCALAEADARLRRIGSARRYVDQMRAELGRIDEVLSRVAA